MPSPLPPIPGTTPFDGDQARKGYALNKMCFSFNDEANRKAFLADEEAYMKQYGPNAQQAAAIPAMGNAIHKGLQNDPYWKPFFDGFPPIRQWLDEKKPDVVVMFYNDHGLNFFLDKMPTFAVGAAAQYNNADEGWGIPTLPPFPGEVDLSWHLINTLIEQEFDVTTCQEMLVDHACTLPLKLFWPEGDCPVAVVPVCI